MPSTVSGRAVRRYLAGDILAVLAFVWVGELAHGIDPLGSPDRYVGVAVPFLVGWALAAPLVGAYAAATLERRPRAVLAPAAAWLGADVVGQVLRATESFPGEAHPVFFLVAGVGGGLSLLALRAVTALAARR